MRSRRPKVRVTPQPAQSVPHRRMMPATANTANLTFQDARASHASAIPFSPAMTGKGTFASNERRSPEPRHVIAAFDFSPVCFGTFHAAPGKRFRLTPPQVRPQLPPLGSFFLPASSCCGQMKIAGDPGRTRTCNPRSRNPLLYPVELRDRLEPPRPGLAVHLACQYEKYRLSPSLNRTVFLKLATKRNGGVSGCRVERQRTRRWITSPGTLASFRDMAAGRLLRYCCVIRTACATVS